MPEGITSFKDPFYNFFDGFFPDSENLRFSGLTGFIRFIVT